MFLASKKLIPTVLSLAVVGGVAGISSAVYADPPAKVAQANEQVGEDFDSIIAWLSAHPEALNEPEEIARQVKSVAKKGDASEQAEVIWSVFPQLRKMASPAQLDGIVLALQSKVSSGFEKFFKRLIEDQPDVGATIFPAMASSMGSSGLFDFLWKRTKKQDPAVGKLVTQLHLHRADSPVLAKMLCKYKSSTPVFLKAVEPEVASAIVTSMFKGDMDQDKDALWVIAMRDLDFTAQIAPGVYQASPKVVTETLLDMAEQDSNEVSPVMEALMKNLPAEARNAITVRAIKNGATPGFRVLQALPPEQAEAILAESYVVDRDRAIPLLIRLGRQDIAMATVDHLPPELEDFRGPRFDSFQSAYPDLDWKKRLQKIDDWADGDHAILEREYILHTQHPLMTTEEIAQMLKNIKFWQGYLSGRKIYTVRSLRDA